MSNRNRCELNYINTNKRGFRKTIFFISDKALIIHIITATKRDHARKCRKDNNLYTV